MTAKLRHNKQVSSLTPLFKVIDTSCTEYICAQKFDQKTIEYSPQYRNNIFKEQHLFVGCVPKNGSPSENAGILMESGKWTVQAEQIQIDLRAL